MKKTDTLFKLLMTVMLMSSCTVYQTVPIEVMQLEEIKLPEGVKRIGWLYRNFKYTEDTLQHYFRAGDVLRKDLANRKTDIDSIAASACLAAAARSFSTNGVNGNPVFFPADMMPRITGEKLSPIPDRLIRKIAQPAQAELIIALETLSWFYSHFPEDISGGEDFRQVEITGVWAIYDAETGAIKETRSMVDTVYWQGSEAGQEELPPRVPAIEMAAEYFGESFAKKFSSGWVQTDRIMMVPPLEEFRLAAELASKEEWDGAREIWERYAAGRFGKLAITARYNLALDAEIHDRYEDAVDMIVSASELAAEYKNRKEMDIVNRYRKILVARLEEIRRSEKPATP